MQQNTEAFRGREHETLDALLKNIIYNFDEMISDRVVVSDYCKNGFGTAHGKRDCYRIVELWLPWYNVFFPFTEMTKTRTLVTILPAFITNEDEQKSIECFVYAENVTLTTLLRTQLEYTFNVPVIVTKKEMIKCPF